MTDQNSFPPLLDLSPDEIQTHTQHLLREIAREPQRARRLFFRKPTRILLAAAGAAMAAAAIAVALVPSSGGRTLNPRSAAPPLAPLYSFHTSITSDSPGGGYYSSTGLNGDHRIPSLTVAAALSGDAASRKHVPRAVLVLAAAQAHAYGNRGPTLVQWVKTTRQKAVSAENAGRVDGGSLPVYFVILHGHFVYSFAPRPPGAKSPRGRILTDTIEIKTGRTLDFGIGNGEPNFAKIGKPHHFVIYGHRRSR